MSINFEMYKPALYLNPKIPSHQAKVYRKAVQDHSLPEHFWFFTSGSSGAPKLIALSKDALLCSAASVNQHLEAIKKDVWALALPTFHVGGMGVLTRAHLTNSKVVHLEKWHPQSFIDILEESKATLTSLVPAQLHDIVSLTFRPSRHLRACIIGGGALSEELYDKARLLGWPILPSFGMTEAASQIATASLTSLEEDSYPDLEVLSHIEAKAEAGILSIRGRSLCSGWLLYEDDRCNFIDPKEDGWLKTDDKVEIVKDEKKGTSILLPNGRASLTIKVKGELTSLEKLNTLLGTLSDDPQNVAIIALPHPRNDHEILLVSPKEPSTLTSLVTVFNKKVLPFERIARVVQVANIPRSDIGKLLYHQLVRLAEEIATSGPGIAS